MKDDSGSVAAEFAVAIPAVVLTLALGLGALNAAATQVALQDAAADAARLLSRGESDARVREAVAASAPVAQVSSHRRDGLVCATATAEFSIGRMIAIPLRATGCALDGGW